MKRLEIRRHARRDPDRDALSEEGKAQAEDAGRTLAGNYDLIFVSPARRAAETVAWFLRARHEQLPAHAVVPGLGGEEGTTPQELARAVRKLLDDVQDGGRALAVGHTPLIERAVQGLTGLEIAPLAECEGVLITQTVEGELRVEEIRR